MEYTIVRILNRTGKRFVYYPTINGKRLTGTNFSRKYDARGLVKNALNHCGEKKLMEIFYGKK